MIRASARPYFAHILRKSISTGSDVLLAAERGRRRLFAAARRRCLIFSELFPHSRRCHDFAETFSNLMQAAPARRAGSLGRPHIWRRREGARATSLLSRQHTSHERSHITASRRLRPLRIDDATSELSPVPPERPSGDAFSTGQTRHAPQERDCCGFTAPHFCKKPVRAR